jgi:hypothetical protein
MQLSVPPLLRVRLPHFVVKKSHVCLLTGGARSGEERRKRKSGEERRKLKGR